MKKTVKRFIGLAIIAMIVIWNVLRTPAILEPVLQIGAIIVIGAVICWLLKAKDKKDAESESGNVYEKLPTWVVLLAVALAGIAVIKMVFPTLEVFKSVWAYGKIAGALILAIFIYCKIRKNAQKEIEDDDKIVRFKPRK